MIRQAVLAELARRNWSQMDLARASGVTQPMLSRWLGGKMSLSLGNAERVLAAMGLELRLKTRRNNL